MTTVYLSGGMMGLTDEQVHGWREEAKRLLPEFEVLDPTRHAWEYPLLQAPAIVARDEADIARSDVVLVHAPRPSWGTAMEVYLAARTYKCPVVAVVPSGAPLSPWLLHHATEVHATLAGACAAIREVYRGHDSQGE